MGRPHPSQLPAAFVPCSSSSAQPPAAPSGWLQTPLTWPTAPQPSAWLLAQPDRAHTHTHTQDQVGTSILRLSMQEGYCRAGQLPRAVRISGARFRRYVHRSRHCVSVHCDGMPLMHVSSQLPLPECGEHYHGHIWQKCSLLYLLVALS